MSEAPVKEMQKPPEIKLGNTAAESVVPKIRWEWWSKQALRLGPHKPPKPLAGFKTLNSELCSPIFIIHTGLGMWKQLGIGRYILDLLIGTHFKESMLRLHCRDLKVVNHLWAKDFRPGQTNWRLLNPDALQPVTVRQTVTISDIY